jgi:hypothetical protein
MKNVRVIDGAKNYTYSLSAATEQEFARLLPDRQDVAFIDEVVSRLQRDEAGALLANLWSRPVLKSAARGIHGTLFYELDFKRKYYPTRKAAKKWKSIGCPSTKPPETCTRRLSPLSGLGPNHGRRCR